jgi:4-amino-4-deoxy-L-arabinose transferase-like glycosyltransferase
MRGERLRQLISPERRYPRSWSSFFWILHFCPGYLYFFIAFSFLLGREVHHLAAAIVLLAFWFVPAVIAFLLERRHTQPVQTA